jgi:hypothetical protein
VCENKQGVELFLKEATFYQVVTRVLVGSFLFVILSVVLVFGFFWFKAAMVIVTL